MRKQERESIRGGLSLLYPNLRSNILSLFPNFIVEKHVTMSSPHSSGDSDTSKLMPGGGIVGTHVRRYLPHAMTGFHFDGDKMKGRRSKKYSHDDFPPKC